VSDPTSEPDDETVAADARPAIAHADEATIVVRAVKKDAKKGRASGLAPQLRESSGSVAMPVDDPDPTFPTDFTDPTDPALPAWRAGTRFDPHRVIAPAPGSLPWDEQPRGQRGLTQGLPVRTGARQLTVMPVQWGEDEVQRTVGPVPPWQAVTIREGRQTLPSLARRDRRARVLTLAAYGCVIAASVAGLLALAWTAFEW
jgi:hypothetical protein